MLTISPALDAAAEFDEVAASRRASATSALLPLAVARLRGSAHEGLSIG
jgi:hypothetical protein